MGNLCGSGSLSSANQHFDSSQCVSKSLQRVPNPSVTGQAGLPELSAPCTHPSVFLWTPHPQGCRAGLVCVGEPCPISTCAESGPLGALCIILMWLQIQRGCLSAQLSGDFFSPSEDFNPIRLQNREAGLADPALGDSKGEPEKHLLSFRALEKMSVASWILICFPRPSQ